MKKTRCTNCDQLINETAQLIITNNYGDCYHERLCVDCLTSIRNTLAKRRHRVVQLTGVTAYQE